MSGNVVNAVTVALAFSAERSSGTSSVLEGSCDSQSRKDGERPAPFKTKRAYQGCTPIAFRRSDFTANDVIG
ncbi:hypothetical protein A3767_32290 [Oleiphilus sp. HI0133]|nr:hypothetical protein A3767_32290 [Oleiphilus sp. HI0133]